MRVVRETAEVYRDVVKPHYVEPMDMKHCNWVYSMLNNEKEVELRVVEHQDFYMQKDFKFNEGDLTTLYCLAVPKQRDLRSVRDLTADHLPLLKAIRDECLAAIEKTFNVPSAKIMSYFHYQPTFYHLHAHFVHVERTMRDTRENVSLDSVIANIEMVPDFYQRTTLTYKVGTQMPLFKVLVDHGVLQPEPEESSISTE